MFLYIFAILSLTVQITTAEIKWLAPPRHTVVILGQDLMLNCSATDTEGSQLTYQWLINDTLVSARHSIFLNHSLLISRITEEDLGQYTCIVRTQSGAEVVSPPATVIKAYIDPFAIYPPSYRTVEGENVTFECVTGRSAPGAEVYWELNGDRFNGGKQLVATFGDYDPTRLSVQYSLKLELVASRIQSGTLRCVAINHLLNKVIRSEDASLYVGNRIGAPSITSVLQPNTIIADGTLFSLDCNHTGFPKTTTNWFQNDTVIESSARKYVNSNGSLFFQPLNLNDTGVYYCEVFNTMGKTQSNTTNVTVATLGISFLNEPSDATVFAGQSKTLNCTPPISIPPAKVTWYKDYRPMKFSSIENTNPSQVNMAPGTWDLYFPSVQYSDSGVYFCVAVNNHSIPTSRTSRAAVLTVEGAPTIIEPPSNKRIIRGRLLQLSCKVIGRPTPSVEWLFSGLPLKLTTKVTFRNGKEELNIGGMGKAEEGSYTCVTKNSYGEKRAEAYVKVVVPPINIKSLGFVVYKLYQSAILPCDIYSDPTPEVFWYKDGIQLPQSSIQLNSAQGLILNNVTLSMEGNYSCKGQNEAGSAWSNGTLKIQVPPEIIEGPKLTTVLIGQPTQLTCKVIGYPQPTISWFLNSTSIKTNEPAGIMLSSDRQYLNITITTWQHVGVYTCIASSSEGTSQKSALLYINVPAQIDQIIGDNVIIIRQEINLRCGAHGSPSPNVTWSHQGKIIQPTSDGRISFPSPYTINIKFVSLQDSGMITCSASNNIGSSQKSVQLYIVDAPKPPLLEGVSPISKSSVKLSWLKVIQAEYTNVTFYRIYYKQRLKENFKLYEEKLAPSLSSYELTNLEAGQEYVCAMAGENEAGIGPISSALSAVTFDSGPSEPRAFQVIKITAKTLTVSWEIPATPNGEIRKYELQYKKKDAGIEDMKSVDIFSPSIPRQTNVLTDLDPNTAYQLQVRAANIQNGQNLWGDYSPILNVKTAIDAPITSPSEFKAIVLTSSSVALQWQPIPQNETHGPILAYIISYNKSDDQAELKVQSDVVSTTINNLSPYTKYSFTVKAENEAGLSPSSDIVTVSTYAAAPASPPVNIKLEALSSDVVQVSWQLPAQSTWNSELSGYKIQYKQKVVEAWQDKFLDDISQRSFLLRDLLSWSDYEVRMAVYTLQVEPGVSPYSSTVNIRTLQAVSGPVGNITFTSTNDSIQISWQQPQKQNGVILFYLLTYNDTKTGETSIRVNGTSFELVDLQSDTDYNISIVSVNIAGYSPSVSITASTSKNEQISYDLTTPNVQTEQTTKTVATEDTGSTVRLEGDNKPTKNLPVIVGASLTVGLFVIFIIILIICKCLKKRRSDRENYVIPSAYKPKRFSSLNERDDISSNNTTNTQPSEVINSSNQSQSSTYGSLAPENNTNTTLPPDSQPPDVVVTSSFPASRTVKKTGRPESFHGDTITGLENPVYSEDDVFSATLPRPHSTSTMSSDELYSQLGKKIKKNRMKSGSAAAIAILRSSTLSITANDTDSLVNNDSVVIYNERTVL